MITHENPAPKHPERVVLLGARGFIAAAIRKELAGRSIPCLPLGSPDLDLAAASAVEELAAALSATDAVVMLAALTPDKGRDVATLMRNLAMMQNTCAAIERAGCAHLVYFSSDAVYDSAVSRVSEDTPASPQDVYGAMHHTREIMAHSLAEVPVLVLRPTLVYGLGDTHNSYGPNRFRRTAQQRGEITLFGGGEESRDHLHVDDLSALTVRCLLRRSTGTLNAATGTSHSFCEVAEVVARQFPDAVEIVRTPRANPVTHRHYDVTDTIKAFPDIRFLSLEEGVGRVHREMVERN